MVASLLVLHGPGLGGRPLPPPPQPLLLVQAPWSLLPRRAAATAAAAAAGSAASSPASVLEFYFTDISKAFKKDPAFDAEIREKFSSLMEAAAAGTLKDWENSPEGCLALIVLLDQFPRNVFRGDAKAFATDKEALRVTRHAIQKGFHEALEDNTQRQFLYMPYMHSEQLEAQKEGLAYFVSLNDERVAAYAKQHLADIEKYGRFPGRNEALGRKSTPEELDYLASGGGY